MYKTISQTVQYLQELVEKTADISREEIELFIIPSYTALESTTKQISQEYIRIGAQNMCWEDEGQFTGEISPLMLRELNIGLVMIGHSERRDVFGETDIEENKKVIAAMNHGLTALLCIGETGAQKELGVSKEVLAAQLKVGFHGVKREQLANIWVAYEPVWSIGTAGVPASAEYAEEMHQSIKNTLKELFGEAAVQIPVLYGGSVNRENAAGLIVQPSVDGLFTGRAAWDASQFNKIIRDAKQAYEESGKECGMNEDSNRV